jgi:hypothetical protein
MHRKRVNISIVLAGQRLGIKEVDDGIWIVSFMHYDLDFIVGWDRQERMPWSWQSCLHSLANRVSVARFSLVTTSPR